MEALIGKSFSWLGLEGSKNPDSRREEAKMSVCKGIGQSLATLDKTQGLGKLLRQHIAVVKRIFDKHPEYPQIYYYIDANAGCGYNYDARCEGSPVIFLKAREEAKIKAKSYFVEINKDNVIQLARFIKPYVGDLVDFRLCPEDNRSAVPRIAKVLPKDAYGLIYFDPNGRPDWDTISRLSKIPALNHFDILIRYNAMAVKRTHKDTGLLMDHLPEVNKAHWMIRDLMPGERWQWTFLLGMNWKMNPWKSQRFYYTDSPEGKEILDKIAYLKTNTLDAFAGGDN